MSPQSTQDKVRTRQTLSPVLTALQQGLGDNLVAVVLFGLRREGMRLRLAIGMCLLLRANCHQVHYNGTSN